MSDNSNVYFILYPPGAKGKFITEICELLSNTFDEELVDTTGNEFKGFPSWPVMFGDYLESRNRSKLDLHGWYPESEQHKNYVDTVIEFSKSYNKKLFVDCHYSLGDSVQYMLDQGCKVIIIKTYFKDRHELLNNFFYKNIILNYPNNFSKKLLTLWKEMIDVKNVKYPISQELKDIYLKIEPYKSTEFHLWPREIKDLLFKTTEIMNSGRIYYFNPNDNCLTIEYDKIGSNKMLVQLSEFINGTIDSRTLNVYNTYSAHQKTIPKYEDYIDNFYQSP